MGLPGSDPEDPNPKPKLYANLVGSVFPDSLLKIGAANIYANGQFSPEDFGNYWFVDQINVTVKFNIKYFNINNGSLQDIINTTNKNNSPDIYWFEIPNNYFCLVINKNTDSNQWKFECSLNGSGATTAGSVKGYGRWCVLGAASANLDVRLFNTNSQYLMKFIEDTNPTIGQLGLSLDYFNIPGF